MLQTKHRLQTKHTKAHSHAETPGFWCRAGKVHAISYHQGKKSLSAELFQLCSLRAHSHKRCARQAARSRPTKPTHTQTRKEPNLRSIKSLSYLHIFYRSNNTLARAYIQTQVNIVVDHKNKKKTRNQKTKNENALKILVVRVERAEYGLPVEASGWTRLADFRVLRCEPSSHIPCAPALE